LNGTGFIPSLYEKGDFRKRLGLGDRPGTIWQPAECDVSIRPGWFYHPSQDTKVKTPKQLRGFRKILDDTFKNDFAKKAKVTASNIRGDDKNFAAENLVAGKKDFYWATDDGVTNASVTLEFKKPITFNVVRLREYLPLGQRVEGFALDQWQNGQWVQFTTGTSIGSCRLIRGEKITTDKVRLRITDSPVCPAISEFGLFAEKP
jgi:alpha-L-fucosidase